MNIKDILANQSAWTYDMIAGSTVLAEVVREDALTSVNLVSINNAARANGINLAITSMQGAKLEDEYGADWSWVLDQKIAYLVQAKKLEVATRKENMGYLINIPQLLKLMTQAEAMSSFYKITFNPIYVFYNSLLDSSCDKTKWGCICVSANNLYSYFEGKKKLEQEHAKLPIIDAIDLGAQPWTNLFALSDGDGALREIPLQNNQTDATQSRLALPW